MIGCFSYQPVVSNKNPIGWFNLYKHFKKLDQTRYRQVGKNGEGCSGKGEGAVNMEYKIYGREGGWGLWLKVSLKDTIIHV